MADLHPCIPIKQYRLVIGLNKTIFERRKPISKFGLWYLKKVLKWEIEEI